MPKLRKWIGNSLLMTFLCWSALGYFRPLTWWPQILTFYIKPSLQSLALLCNTFSMCWLSLYSIGLVTWYIMLLSVCVTRMFFLTDLHLLTQQTFFTFFSLLVWLNSRYKGWKGWVLVFPASLAVSTLVNYSILANKSQKLRILGNFSHFIKYSLRESPCPSFQLSSVALWKCDF